MRIVLRWRSSCGSVVGRPPGGVRVALQQRCGGVGAVWELREGGMNSYMSSGVPRFKFQMFSHTVTVIFFVQRKT